MMTTKQNLKPLILSVGFLFMGLAACKNDKKDLKVVGTNEAGEELTVTETGDTITLKEAQKNNSETSTDEVALKTEENKEVEKKAFTKNADDTYTFLFNLEKDKTYPFKVVTNTTSSQSDGQNTQEMKQSSENELSYQVKEVKADSYVMNVTFKKFKENNSMGGQSLGFDTSAARPANEMIAQQYDFYKAVVGNSFTMEIAKNGKVLNVDGLKPIRDKVKAKVSKGLSEEEKKGLDQLLEAALSNQAMEMMFVESIGFYPTKAVKAGEKWEMKNNSENAKSKMEYTLKEVGENSVDITIKGNSNGKDSQTLKEGMKITRSINGDVTGNAKINVKTGWLENAKINKKEVLKLTQEYKGEKRNMSSTTTSNTSVN